MRRRLARERAIQCLFAIDVGHTPPDEAIASAVALEGEDEPEGDDGEAWDRSFMEQLVRGTLAHREAIDTIIRGHLRGWTLERLAAVDRAILRMALYELLFHEDVPPKVTIDEAVELAKTFGDEASPKFVNGVLSTVAREQGLLPAEEPEQAAAEPVSTPPGPSGPPPHAGSSDAVQPSEGMA
ncbi:transcription antitermination factor NusB [Calditerricola satsumensis]